MDDETTKDVGEQLAEYDRKRAALVGLKELLEEVAYKLRRAGMRPYSVIHLGFYEDPADLEAIRVELDGSRRVLPPRESDGYVYRQVESVLSGVLVQATSSATPPERAVDEAPEISGPERGAA